jgi:hypothetical protein
MIAVAVGSLFHLVSVYSGWHVMNPTAKQCDLLAHRGFNDLERERICDELMMQKRHFQYVTGFTGHATSDCIEVGDLCRFDDLKWHSIFKDHSTYFSQQPIR